MAMRHSRLILRLVFFLISDFTKCGGDVHLEFLPVVSARCSSGIMTVTVQTQFPFLGVVHARGKRIPGCYVYGSGENSTSLKINLLETEQSKIYCGVHFNNATEERSIAIAVRIHRTLELADDKFYIITCGKSGFRNTRNETSQVSLKLLDENKAVDYAVYGHKYRLRTQISKHDRSIGMHVSSCYGFSGENSTLLIDRYGCPFPRINFVMSEFKYDFASGSAEAIIFRMFKFPSSNQVHIQCDVRLCPGLCPVIECERASHQDEPTPGLLTATTTVFVVDPGEAIRSEKSISEDCNSSNSWLMPLSIILGILFLIMLIINIFLCSAMTSVCTVRRTRKKPSCIDPFDPYRITWNENPFDSRYSIRTTEHYASGMSTINSSKSIDHYDFVQSRPQSRYSKEDSLKGYIIKNHDSFSKSSSKI